MTNNSRYLAKFIFLALLGTATSAFADDGAAIWKKKCASCHGAVGKGDTKLGKKMGVADMSAAEWQKKFTDDALKKATTDGVDREVDGKKQKMKGYKDLTAADLDALVQLMRGFAQ